MAWVKLDDHMDEHPKLAKVGPLGFALAVHGLLYSGRNLTDGFIPYPVAIKLVPWEYIEPTDDQGREKLVAVGIGTPERLSRESGFGCGRDADSHYVIGLLVKVGIWEEVEGGYQIHDYREYQPSREQVLTERVASRNQRVAAGMSRAANATRENGRFIPQQLNTSAPAATPAKEPSERQRATSPVPVPVPVEKIKDLAASPLSDFTKDGIDQELTTRFLEAAVRSRTKPPPT